MRKLIAALLIPASALPGPVLADCRHATYTPTYYAPTYHAPTYYDPYAVVVAKAVPVYLPLYSYASIGDDVRAFYSLKRAVREGTLEGMQDFAASQPGPGPSPPAPSPSPPPPDGPTVPPLASPKVNAQPIPPAKGSAKAANIKAILSTRCASCHNPAKDPDRVNLSIDPALIPSPVRDKCVVFVTDGSMPKKAAPIPQEEFDALVAWAKSANK